MFFAESEGLRFDSSWDSEFFLCPMLVTRQKTSFSISLLGSKFTISLIAIYKCSLFDQCLYIRCTCLFLFDYLQVYCLQYPPGTLHTQ